MNSLAKAVRSLLAIVVSFAALALTGCASITGSSQQSLSVETRDSTASVTGVTCELSNDKGKWFLNTPGSAYIQKSSENLNVLCKKDGISPGQASVASTTKAGMVGNILFGGIIGMAIDHSTGAAYEYPPLIQVMMGTSVVIGAVSADTTKSQLDMGTSGTQQVTTNTQTNVTPPTTPSSIPTMSMDAARVRCTDLGMKPQTESFGQCVMKLSK
jgi:hypothetical protein